MAAVGGCGVVCECPDGGGPRFYFKTLVAVLGKTRLYNVHQSARLLPWPCIIRPDRILKAGISKNQQCCIPYLEYFPQLPCIYAMCIHINHSDDFVATGWFLPPDATEWDGSCHTGLDCRHVCKCTSHPSHVQCVPSTVHGKK